MAAAANPAPVAASPSAMVAASLAPVHSFLQVGRRPAHGVLGWGLAGEQPWAEAHLLACVDWAEVATSFAALQDQLVALRPAVLVWTVAIENAALALTLTLAAVAVGVA